jgi:quinoprotein glucose dehydrogenase
MPSIVKLVPEGESTTANAGGLVPSRPRNAPRRKSPFPTQEQMGRAVYEQNCQFCHGPELKGDRGPALDTVVSRLGADTTRSTILHGRATMPSFSALPAESLNELMSFLKQPDLAPLGTAASPSAQAMMRAFRTEPSYPEGVDGPPSRYKTGYGNEPYVITPPWSTITAYDLNTGKIKWKTPYGDVPQAGPSDTLRGNIYPKSGFVTTAGGLVLFAGNDSKLYVLNSADGKVIFTKDLPNGSQGVPAVYEANGREFVLFSVSGGGTVYPEGAYMPPGGKSAPATSKEYIAFALPAGMK